MPVPAAQYLALLARALPGTPMHALKWEVSLCEGWSLIHAGGIMEGQSYIWPDPRLSSGGRTLLKVQELREQMARGEWEPDVGL